MSDRLTIVSWCPGDACDPCGCSLAAAGMQHLTVAGNIMTATYGRPDSIAGKTLCDPIGLLTLGDLDIHAGNKWIYTYFDGSTFTGNPDDVIPIKTFTFDGSPFTQGGATLSSGLGTLVPSDLSVSGPGFSGTRSGWDFTMGDSTIPFDIVDQSVSLGDTFQIIATSSGGFGAGSDLDIDTTSSPFGSPYQYRYQP